ncbi:hypothetical protein Chor_002010 [Crotalus horridus]
MSIIQALAMTVAEIPVFLYTTFGQSAFSALRITPGLRKVLFATALGTVALALTAHQLKRRRRKKRITPEKLFRPSAAESRQQEQRHAERDLLLGAQQAFQLFAQPGLCMELFEEALQKWEQALTVRQRDPPSLSASWVVPREEDLLLPEDLCEESQKKEFADKLELLLYRAYNLQEEFGSSLSTDNLLLDLEILLWFLLFSQIFDSLEIEKTPFQPSKPAVAYEEALQLVKDGLVLCRTFRRSSLEAVFSEDLEAGSPLKLVSSEDLEAGSPLKLVVPQGLGQLYPDVCSFWKRIGLIDKPQWTSVLNFNSHPRNRGFQRLISSQELLLVENNQTFFGEVGKRMVMGLMTKAEKNTKGFLESYKEMLLYTLRQETWPTTQKELEGRGVVCMNFFDVALDFILLDALEDLENPPSSVVAILRNRWLSDSFKETALATACWSVLKAKRRLLMVHENDPIRIPFFLSLQTSLQWGFDETMAGDLSGHLVYSLQDLLKLFGGVF